MTRGFQGRSLASLCCKKAAVALASGLGALVAAGSQHGVLAQRTVFVDQHAQADVIVDLSAIDQAIKNQNAPGNKAASAGAATAGPSVTLTPPKMSTAATPSGEAPIVLRPPGQNPEGKSAVANASSENGATPAKGAAPDFASLIPVKPTTQKTTPQSPSVAAASTASPPSSSVASGAQSSAAGSKGTAVPSATAGQQPALPASASPQAPPSPSPPLTADQTPPPPAASEPATQVAVGGATASPSKPGGNGQSFVEPALSISFGAGGSELPYSARGDLDKIIDTLKQSSAARVQLLAYAAGTDEQASQVRRLSLDRALAVRKYLLDQGIASSRIDVKALGNKVEGGRSPDRVDLMVEEK